jgi:hypothetical protein
MPTKRRRRGYEHRGTLDSPRTREHLLSGHDWSFLDGPALDDDDLAAAWDMLAEELLAEHIAERPGSRPWGWWRWSAPSPRRQIRPGPATVGEAVWFGRPAIYKGIPPADMFEDERSYLARLNLLRAGE